MPPRVKQRQEYRVGDDDWKVERMDLLLAALPELTAEQLPAFHQAVAVDGRAWLFARRLWGIMPLVPQAGMSLEDDFRVWTATELKAALGMDARAHRAELDRVAGLWMAFGRASGRSAKAAAEGKARQAALFDEELPLPEPVDLDRELREAGFMPSMFEVADRPASDNALEKRRFVERMRNVAKPLAQDALHAVVRSLLLVQLDIERAEAEFYSLSPKDGRKKALGEMRRQLEEDHRAINDQLFKLSPSFFRAGETGVGMTGSFTMLVEGMQRLRSQADETLLRGVGDVTGILVDGIHDPEEVAFQLRLSKEGLVSGQGPQYDPGWVAYVLASRAGFWDPRFEPFFDKALLARIRRWMPERWVELCKEDGAHIPELSAAGPEGEYQDDLSGVKPAEVSQ